MFLNNKRLRAAVSCLGILFLCTGPAFIANAATQEIINFSTGDPATDPGTEGIAVDDSGNIYVSANTADGGQIWKVSPGATEPEVLTTLIPPTGGAGFGVLGLDRDGPLLYAAVHTLANPELNGVWIINTWDGFARHIAGSEAIGLPNDITRVGDSLYVTDTATGAVWRIDPDGTELWLEDDLLFGLGNLVAGLPLGANGIDAYRNRLYVTNLEKGLIVQVDINRRTGEARQPTVFAQIDGQLLDGVEVDRYGRPHAVALNSNRLYRINRGGRAQILIDDATVLDSPASLVFDPRCRRSTIYVVNFSIAEGFPDMLEPSDVGPSVVAYSAGRGKRVRGCGGGGYGRGHGGSSGGRK